MLFFLVKKMLPKIKPLLSETERSNIILFSKSVGCWFHKHQFGGVDLLHRDDRSPPESSIKNNCSFPFKYIFFVIVQLSLFDILELAT